MLDEIENLIQIEKGRIFIDIALEGCGSGCSYCYIKKPLYPQILISKNESENVIKKLGEIISDNDIMSFCPNTEPLKTEKSRKLIFDIINYFGNKNVVFQISTKESIPESYLVSLNNLATINPIYIFISIPFLETDLIEPNAASLYERTENFKKIHKFMNLRSCLYIKPFNSSCVPKKDRFCKLIDEFNPDEICVGMQFKKDSSQPCSTLHHPEEAKVLLTESNNNDFYDFTEYLRTNTGRRVYYSSVCIIANNFKTHCLINMDGIDRKFCRECDLYQLKERYEHE